MYELEQLMLSPLSMEQVERDSEYFVFLFTVKIYSQDKQK